MHYHREVADSRNPPSRRPPVLPLPPPRDDAERRRAATNEATGELPRLPEVGVVDGSANVALRRRDAGNEVRLDHRALAPPREMLSGARSIPVEPGRVVKPPT